MDTIEEAVDHIAAQFDDGFQMSDVWECVTSAMQIAEEFEDLEGSEKKEKVIQILDKLLDRFDLPGPDWLTKKAILWILPSAIDKLVEAAQGRFDF